MTYKELLQKLQQLNEEQLLCDVSIYDIGNDEFYPMEGLHFTDETTVDALDPNHPYLSF